jgi:uncharacterized membrane protein
VLGLLQWGEPGALAIAAGGVIYVLGMFVVTMVFNVPLNNALARSEPMSADTAPLWARYLKDWRAWNHLRTVASTAASAFFTWALVSLG